MLRCLVATMSTLVAQVVLLPLPDLPEGLKPLKHEEAVVHSRLPPVFHLKQRRSVMLQLAERSRMQKEVEAARQLTAKEYEMISSRMQDPGQAWDITAPTAGQASRPDLSRGELDLQQQTLRRGASGVLPSNGYDLTGSTMMVPLRALSAAGFASASDADKAPVNLGFGEEDLSGGVPEQMDGSN
mmetsp:Transcript_37376/g.81670  ORF Transcript_37376/g.81670 Transcript_37376/m.81670 type:complete len:185 (-) Transcript_37376:63-617(-)